MSEQAKRAYEAYTRALGPGFATWDALSARIQGAWRDAVAAAIDSPPRSESLVDKQVRLLHEQETAKIARDLKAMMPPDRGFLLLTVDYGREGNIAYVSTVDREDATRLMREFLSRWGAL